MLVFLQCYELRYDYIYSRKDKKEYKTTKAFYSKKHNPESGGLFSQDNLLMEILSIIQSELEKQINKKL